MSRSKRASGTGGKGAEEEVEAGGPLIVVATARDARCAASSDAIGCFSARRDDLPLGELLPPARGEDGCGAEAGNEGEEVRIGDGGAGAREDEGFRAVGAGKKLVRCGGGAGAGLEEDEEGVGADPASERRKDSV